MSEPMRRVLVVVNPAAGRGRAAEACETLARALRERGLDAEVAVTSQKGDAARLAAEAVGAVDAVVAAGGDGTMNELAQGILFRAEGRSASALPALGMVSFGTGNCAAAGFQIPRSFDDALDVIAKGKTRFVDAGVMERSGTAQKDFNVFLLWCGAGLDGEVIHAVASKRSGSLKRGTLHYAWPIARALLRYPFPPIRVEADGVPFPPDARQVIVANVGQTAAFLNVAPDADPSDGRFDVVAIYEKRGIRWGALMLAALEERLASFAGVRVARASTIRIFSVERVPVQLDGEEAGFLPLEITLRRHALRLLVP